MFFSIKYKENEEKYIKLFGNIKEKCYFCSRVEILASRDFGIWALSAPYIKRGVGKDSGIWAQTSSLYKKEKGLGKNKSE